MILLEQTGMMIQRRRNLYGLWIVLVMGAGLLWRSSFFPLSWFFSKYGGDALWALLVFLGFGFLFSKTSTPRLALAALCFSWIIEFSQLYHAPWIDSVRATRMGGLILGSIFNIPDLPACVAGIALGAIGEYFCFARTSNYWFSNNRLKKNS
jgi:hypothetical protein